MNCHHEENVHDEGMSIQKVTMGEPETIKQSKQWDLQCQFALNNPQGLGEVPKKGKQEWLVKIRNQYFELRVSVDLTLEGPFWHVWLLERSKKSRSFRELEDRGWLVSLAWCLLEQRGEGCVSTYRNGYGYHMEKPIANSEQQQLPKRYRPPLMHQQQCWLVQRGKG
jgi:hypothetical protein